MDFRVWHTWVQYSSLQIRDLARGRNGKYLGQCLTHSICSRNEYFFLIITVMRVRCIDLEMFLPQLHPDLPKLIQNDIFARCFRMKNWRMELETGSKGGTKVALIYLEKPSIYIMKSHRRGRWGEMYELGVFGSGEVRGSGEADWGAGRSGGEKREFEKWGWGLWTGPSWRYFLRCRWMSIPF